MVPVNRMGHRLGECHQNATLTDREVELIRQLHAEKAMGYRKLAKKFETSVSNVRHICKYLRRCSTPVAWRKVHVTP